MVDDDRFEVAELRRAEAGERAGAAGGEFQGRVAGAAIDVADEDRAGIDDQAGVAGAEEEREAPVPPLVSMVPAFTTVPPLVKVVLVLLKVAPARTSRVPVAVNLLVASMPFSTSTVPLSMSGAAIVP